jgi:predicted metal-dependent hydrolase
MEYPIEIQRSKRRTVSLSVESDLHVLVKAPLRMSGAEVGAFVEKHRNWIEKQILLQRERQKNAHDFTPAEVSALKCRAREIAETGIRTYAPIMGVAPIGVKITSAVTRWGSCSGKNSICFSYQHRVAAAGSIRLYHRPRTGAHPPEKPWSPLLCGSGKNPP